MLKVVGVIGYKDSGKTTLVRALARELVARGHDVAAVKHVSHHLEFPEKDTTALAEATSQVGFVSPQGSGLFWSRPLGLEEMLSLLEADFILVEGFKAEKTFPKIVCLRGKPDDRELFDGLAICAVGPADVVGEPDVPVLDRNEIAEIADLVERKAFKLPRLDCGGCGYERCYDLAREIVAGKARAEDCVSLQPIVEVRVDGRPLPLNPFVAGIVRGTILGLLSPLKGFKKGRIEIEIEGDGGR